MPPSPPAQESLLRLLTLAHRETMLAFERAVGVSDARLRVLAAIAAGRSSMGEIRETARMDQSVVSRMMAVLEGEGLVVRASPDVRRDRRYALSATGRALFRSVTLKSGVFEKAIVASLDTADLRSCREALMRIREAAKAINEHG